MAGPVGPPVPPTTGAMGNNQATTTPVFDGSEPLMKGFYYDLPSELNHGQFSKTTKKMVITMGSDMGVYARDLATAFTNLDLVRLVPLWTLPITQRLSRCIAGNRR